MMMFAMALLRQHLAQMWSNLFPSDSTVILVPILFLWAENGYLQWNLQVPGALAGPDHAASLNTAANSSVTMNVQQQDWI